MIYLTDKRKEVKYISNFKNKIISQLKSDSFKEQYISREVFSIYYDTDKLNFFKDHIDGNDKRSKYRLRTYNIKFNNKNSFNFEKKIKEFEYNYKKIIKNYIEIDDIEKKIPNLNIDDYGNLFPVLAVSYNRKYYFNNIFENRATIDSNIIFYPIFRNKIFFKKYQKLKNLYVKEEKIPKDNIKKTNIENICKFSKYIHGINYLKKNTYDFY